MPAEIAVEQVRPAPSAPLHSGELNALSLAVVTDRGLHRKVSEADRIDLGEVRSHAMKVLNRYRTGGSRRTAQPMDIHRQVMAGVAGEAILIASALVLDTLGEAEKVFHLSFKTIKSRVGRTLDPGRTELVLRMTRATLTAAEVLGSLDAARAYLRTRNFALGGATPLELLQSAEGERIVLNELQAQADGGPV
jgi:hypothetical protein